MAHLINLIYLSIYLSALLKSASNVRTFEADLDLYIWGRFSQPQMYVHLRPILAKLTDQMCHKSLISCLEMDPSISICTFEADFLCHRSASNVRIGLKCMYIWGEFEIGLKCTAVWVAEICLSQSDSCTFEANSYIWGRIFENVQISNFWYQ